VKRPSCLQCLHFVDDPAAIEAEFPYLTPFGSGYSSVRGHAGMCQARDLFLDPMPADECEVYTEAERERARP